MDNYNYFRVKIDNSLGKYLYNVVSNTNNKDTFFLLTYRQLINTKKLVTHPRTGKEVVIC